MIIGLEIKKVNNELVIVSKYLKERWLTSNFYINEFFRLSNKLTLNNCDEIIMNIGKDTYVIKETFNKNKTISVIVKKLITLDIV